MGLRDEVDHAHEVAPQIGASSKLAKLFRDLGQADADELKAMLGDPEIRPIDIWAALEDRANSGKVKTRVTVSSVRKWCRETRYGRRE